MHPRTSHLLCFVHTDARREQLAAALTLLRDAWEGAEALRIPPRELAIEAQEFWVAGVSTTLLHWLTAQGYAEFVAQWPEHSDGWAAGADGCPRRCVMLTRSGLSFAADRLDGSRPERTPCKLARPEKSQCPAQPRWDGEIRRLYWDGVLVKHFRVPAWNQEQILAAFEEEGWPARIYDPLPPSRGLNPRARLRETIKSLNHHQLRPLLCFRGDGTGEGVLWHCAGALSSPGSPPDRPLIAAR
jgi:hypothetical protein